MSESRAISVAVTPTYLPEQSDPAAARHAHAYEVQIVNVGGIGARLLSRHWILTEADGRVSEVRGDGVVGEQPWLAPGETFRYRSGAVFQTPVGTMQGSYTFIDDAGERFDVEIPRFVLAVPRTLH
jgi:ApaG protein